MYTTSQEMAVVYFNIEQFENSPGQVLFHLNSTEIARGYAKFNYQNVLRQFFHRMVPKALFLRKIL